MRGAVSRQNRYIECSSGAAKTVNPDNNGVDLSPPHVAHTASPNITEIYYCRPKILIVVAFLSGFQLV